MSRGIRVSVDGAGGTSVGGTVCDLESLMVKREAICFNNVLRNKSRRPHQNDLTSSTEFLNPHK